ncbi:hypothetical protein BGZ61DRAFT_535193 [Ilyonectria robusta]|uniref:uncharacterized protein n=1 Tax=Ilyonectria robusta TaxID=1079257 RepID=UPI001E8D4232|nr:uncharacterized protein BGZ61DRAFT_535193 [Ilyonectria robusta]KAH8683781.1 hypothetical protein BGZ61DRAFT_535193 [Ilyonectria robusta]
MRVLPALFFISTLTPVARTFEFTAPDTTKPINFSEPVVFEWPIVGGNPLQPWLQLIFATGDSSGSGRWGINFERLDTRNTSTWTWDAPEWIANVTADGFEQLLVKGKNNWFEASLSRLPYSNQSWSSNLVATDKFEVEGYPYLRDPYSGAGVTTPSLSLALAAGAMTLIFGLTS